MWVSGACEGREGKIGSDFWVPGGGGGWDLTGEGYLYPHFLGAYFSFLKTGFSVRSYP